MNRINLPKCYVLNSPSQINPTFRTVFEVFKTATNIIQETGLMVLEPYNIHEVLGSKPLTPILGPLP